MQTKAITIAALSFALLLTACGGAESRRASHMERGQKYYTEGNFEKARVEFRNALQITPNDAEARYMNGRVAEQLGDVRSAAGMYQSAIDIAPEHAQARANLGRVLVFAGQQARALEIVEVGLAKHPDDADLLTVRGAARMQSGDRPAAFADAQRAVELAPDNEGAVALLASLHRQSGEPHRAVELLKATIEKHPSAVDLRQVLASIYLSTGETALAEAQLQKIIELRPKALGYRVQLASQYVRNRKLDDAEKVMKQAAADLPDSLEAKLAYVDFVSTQRSREQGETLLKQFIAKDADNYDLQLGLASLQQRMGQVDAAVATYNKVIERAGEEPAALTARNRLAAVHVSRGENDQAAKLIETTLAKNPRDNDALILRGNLALERNDPAGAVADLRAVLRDQPSAVGVLRTLARAHLANGEPALAEETIRTAMDAAPNDASVRVEMAQLLAQTNRADQAVSLLEEAVKKQPTNIPAREALVRAYIGVKDFEQARKAVDDLQVAAPKAAIGPYLAAVVDVARGKPDLAMKRLSDVVAANPQDPAARNFLGELQIGAKNWPAATETLTTATTLAPKWWLPYRNLAFAQIATGNTTAAIETYKAGIAATQHQATLVADLAALYERDGHIDEAIKQYQTLHDTSPTMELAANNLAMLLVTYKKDRPSLDRARAITAPFAESKNGVLLDTHGWVMFKLGQYNEALPVLERAAELAPNQKVIRFHLGMAQLKSGQQDKARGNLEAALAGTANFAGADEARLALGAL